MRTSKKALFEDELERCGICGRKGKKIPYEGQYFCSQEHVRLFKEKDKAADRKLATIKTCSTCGKPIKGKGLPMTDTYIKKLTDEFKVYKFCNGKCLDNWGIEGKEKDPFAKFFGIDSSHYDREIRERRMRLRIVWDTIMELRPKGEIPIREIKRMGIEQGMTKSEIEDALKSFKERELISEAGKGKIKVLQWRR
jgi:hypothetical protein